ncbi:hypothetical protein DUI87_24511 [Hirundo rustica rustica]|uniref:Uncharacterized protein n=1 Tax=Hirundo rustica rustica TaxID=333673 RepID=A0A3M0JVI9_HIRRU|nr:hypothetical protein DUI87_24511 [Hirundo rustica rustica]
MEAVDQLASAGTFRVVKEPLAFLRVLEWFSLTFIHTLTAATGVYAINIGLEKTLMEFSDEEEIHMVIKYFQGFTQPQGCSAQPLGEASQCPGKEQGAVIDGLRKNPATSEVHLGFVSLDMITKPSVPGVSAEICGAGLKTCTSHWKGLGCSLRLLVLDWTVENSEAARKSGNTVPQPLTFLKPKFGRALLLVIQEEYHTGREDSAEEERQETLAVSSTANPVPSPGKDHAMN